MVAVRLLGTVSVAGSGGEVDLLDRGRRAAVAFAYLALATGPVHRDELAGIVWDAQPPATWRSALRNTISTVRRCLDEAGLDGSDVLGQMGDGYRLDLPDGAWVDMLEAECVLQEATEALRGGDPARTDRLVATVADAVVHPFAPGCTGTWRDAVEGRLADLRRSLLLLRGEAALQLEEPERTETLTRRVLDADGLVEPAHRLLMQARWEQGNLAGALVAFDQARTGLREELGTAPSKPTLDLYRRLLHASRDDAHRDASAMPASLAVQLGTPFVGRSDALDRLAPRRTGSGPVLCVAEPGAGKTRLAAAVASAHLAAGRPTLYGRTDEYLRLPYQPFVEALREIFARVDEHDEVLGHVRRTLGELFPDPAGATSAVSARKVDEGQIVAAFLDLLASSEAAHPMLLVLDDLQRAGAETWNLLGEVVRSERLRTVQVLALSRPASLPEVAESVVEMMDVHHLGPLDGADLGRLVTWQFPSIEPTSDMIRELALATGGNALYVSVLLRELAATDLAQLDHWHHRPSESLRELVRRRVAALAPEDLDLLHVAAITGEEFELALVSALVDADVDHTRARVRRLDEAGLVRLVDSATGAFRHALVRHCLVDSVPERRHQEIHRLLAEQLQPTTGPGASPRIAHHLSQVSSGGASAAAARYCLEAALEMAALHALTEALAFADQGLDALGDDRQDATLELRLRTVRAAARRGLHLEGWQQELDAVWGGALALGDASLLADAALAGGDDGVATDMSWRDEVVMDRYRQALQVLPDDDAACRARLLGRLASAMAWREQGDAGRELAEQALTAAREAGDPTVSAFVLRGCRAVLTGSGKVERQHELERWMLDLADDLGHDELRIRVLLWRFDTAVEGAQGESLSWLLRRAGEDLAAGIAGQHRHAWESSSAALALLRGRLADAERLITSAAATGVEIGIAPEIVESIRLTQMMGLRHEQGRLAELRDELGDWFAHIGVPEWLAALGFIDVELGQPERSADVLVAGIEHLLEHGTSVAVGPGYAAHLAAPLATVGDTRLRERMYTWLEPFAGQGSMFGYVGGPVDFSRGLLARSLGYDEDARGHFEDALAVATRLDAPRWRRRCQAQLA